MSHAGHPVVAPHLGFSATANSTEGAAIAARILALESLATEALSRLSSRGWGLGRPSAEPSRTTANRRIPPESRSSAAKTIRHRSIGIRNTQPVTGIVRPYIPAAEPRMKIAETEAMEEADIQENPQTHSGL